MGTSQKSISAFIEAFPKVTAVEETLTNAVVNFRGEYLILPGWLGANFSLLFINHLQFYFRLSIGVRAATLRE